jgi:hypothetical protein
MEISGTPSPSTSWDELGEWAKFEAAGAPFAGSANSRIICAWAPVAKSKLTRAIKNILCMANLLGFVVVNFSVLFSSSGYYVAGFLLLLNSMT